MTANMKQRVVCYARVSRDDLHCENQQRILDAWLERNKTEIESSRYEMEEESTRKTRPVKERLIKEFREGKFDTIVVSRLDRWARSTIELVQDVESVVNQGGRFVCISNAFDFQKSAYNATAQLQLSIFAAFAQFERELIHERTLDGLARAKSQGKIGGRHPVGCGCGFRSADGKVVHNGPIKPKRDEHNKAVGWQDTKQTPSVLPVPIVEEKLAQ